MQQFPESLGVIRVFERQAFIWSRGEAVSIVYFLKRGQVAITIENAQGHDIVTNIVRPEEPLGVTFLRQQRAVAITSAVALMRCELLEVAIEEFKSFLRASPDAAAAFVCSMSERVADAEERIRVLANHDAEDRLCALLEHLALRNGRQCGKSPGLWSLKLTHAELSRFAGLSRAHVSVVMGRLRQKGLVSYGPSTALLVNIAAVEHRRRSRHAAAASGG